jgi:VCBS repeat-containing protein
MVTALTGTAGNDSLVGTAGNDLILGLGGNDRLIGAEGDDTLDGGAGTNQIDAGAGNDLILLNGTAVNGALRVPATGIDGGTGTDTLQFAGRMADFHIVQIAGGWLQVDDLVTGGRTLAVNVEHLQFTDAELWLVAPNSAPTIAGDVVGALVEGGTLVLDALATASDSDVGTVLSVTGLGPLPGGIGFDPVTQSFTVDGSAFDALAAGEVQTLRLDYGVTDGIATTAASAVITVTGVNDAAQVSGEFSGAVTEDGTLTASGQLTVVDVDHDQAGFVVETRVGVYGSLSMGAAGAWTYALDNAALAVQALTAGQVVTDRITVHSLDGTAAEIVVSVTGAADASLLLGSDMANRLTGTKMADVIFGLGGADRINGGAGDDVLSGGSGADVFIFTGRFGHDVITDFSTDTLREVIDLSHLAGAESFADLRANHMTELAGDTILSFGQNTITLTGVEMSSLTAGDFLF